MILQEISVLLQRGKANDLKNLVSQALEQGVEPKTILNEALIAGMSIIGHKFKNNEVFVPEVLIAARAMNAGMEVIKPELIATGIEPIGKALICTVKGDLHDIGKNLVKMMFEGQGIECVDLGVDVDKDVVVEAVKTHNPDILCLSALLTTTMFSQQEIIQAITEASLRDDVMIMIGGAPVTQEFADQIGADAYKADAASAAEYAKEYLLGR
jgi:5-methyltetrahydrofolate--homocysteine methyltransferase